MCLNKNKMKDKNLIYALAGLFHDIGKFGQRADDGYQNSSELSAQSKKIAAYLCNTTQEGYFTHQHVIWTNNFLEEHKSIFHQSSLLGEGENNLINLAAYHHKPTSFEQAIITLADHWSSGIDRNSERYLEKNKEWGKTKYKSVPLVSVFNELFTNTNKTGIDDNYGHKLQPQNISDDIFPQKVTELDLKESFPDLWKKFNSEFSKIGAQETNQLIYSIYNLLKKYTWYIPASTMDYPNSSLFEHMKLTGAFSHCFAEYFNENKEAYDYNIGSRIILKDGYFPIIMVCCDVYGIQNFIYNISNKSAMKSLKGRSFYVQLLTETLSEELLESCNLSIVNQIYSAGGKFYLLLPNTKDVMNIVKKFYAKTQEKLWDEYKGKVSINLAIQQFTLVKGRTSLMAKIPNEDNKFSIGELWHRLADETAKSKKSKYNDVIKHHYKNLFEPIGKGGETIVCSISGEELDKNTAVELDRALVEQESDENSIFISTSMNNQIKLGNSLYESKYLTEIENKNKNSFSISNSHFLLSKDIPNIDAIRTSLIQFQNEPYFLSEGTSGFGFRYYGGVPMAIKDNKTATLQDLCLKDNSESDYTKLGVLRMDVDNLGMLFQKGFGENASFSKMATLSSLLEQFFSGHINYIKYKEKYKSNINIVYSGGDDVFAVGRWDKLIEFGMEVRQSFKKFVCNRDDITLSAGMVIISPKFPISKAAELSGEAEADAKNFELDGLIEKDAINLFGITVKWQEEMPLVLELKNNLVDWISNKSYISKGVLMKMFDYYAQYQNNNIEWRWQAAYSLARQEKSSAKDSERSKVFSTLKNILFINRYNNHHIRFEAFILACRWAELELKNKNN